MRRHIATLLSAVLVPAALSAASLFDGPGAACIVQVNQSLFDTEFARDELARTVIERGKLRDVVLAFRDGGLHCRGYRRTTLLPDVRFECLLDGVTPRPDVVELKLRQADATRFGVAVRWIADLLSEYFRARVDGSSLRRYFEVAATGWRVEGGEKIFVATLTLNPAAIVRTLQNPSIVDVRVAAGTMRLAVDGR